MNSEKINLGLAMKVYSSYTKISFTLKLLRKRFINTQELKMRGTERAKAKNAKYKVGR